MYVRTSSAVILKVFLQATHSVDWEVLEPSSPALQASAIPSQLPVREQVVGFRRWAIGLELSLRDHLPLQPLVSRL